MHFVIIIASEAFRHFVITFTITNDDWAQITSSFIMLTLSKNAEVDLGLIA